MCRILNMEDVIDDIIDQLGLADTDHREFDQHSTDDHQIFRSKISFEDFMCCRLQFGVDQKPRLEALEQQLSNYNEPRQQVLENKANNCTSK